MYRKSDQHKPLWEMLQQGKKDGYHAELAYVLSQCSYSYGWNVKFKRGSKTICMGDPREDLLSCCL